MSKRTTKRGARTLENFVHSETVQPSERIARYSDEYRAWLLRQMTKQSNNPNTGENNDA